MNFLTSAGRAILADEPGLGKTAQALVALTQLNAKDVLIVCPKVAAGVWEDESTAWIDRPVQHYHGTSRRQNDLRHGIVTTNYSLLNETLKGKHYDAIIWDEYHRQLRNRKTKTRFVVAQRYASSNAMFFISGTPISKSAGDIWPALHLIDKRKYRGYWPFVQKYAEVWTDDYGWHVEGVINEDILRRDLSRVMLWRKKRDVLTELPPKVRQFIRLQMTPKQRKLYHELTKDKVLETESGSILAVPSALAMITRLRQLLFHPALLGIDAPSALFEAVTELIAEEEQPHIAIYTPFTEGFPLIEDMVTRLGYVFHPIRGGMTEKQLQATVREFEHGDGKHALVCSLYSATSFTAVSTARPYFMGEDWEPDIMTQAEDRHDRIGQKDTVMPRYFVHHGTVQMHLHDVLEGKTTIQRLVMDPENLLNPAWGSEN